MAKPNFNKNCRGSVLILFAFLMPLFIFMAGAAVDAGRAFVCKAEINKACMIAAEEASKEIDIDFAQMQGSVIIDTKSFNETVSKYFYSNILPKDNYNIESFEVDIMDSQNNPGYIIIKCRSRINCFFLKAAGIDSITVNSSAIGRLRRIK
jgi:hypothetical protein